MNYMKELKDAVSILKMDESVMMSVAKRSHATWFGVAILLVPTVVNLILTSFSFPSGFGSIFSTYLIWPMFIPVLSFVGGIILMGELARRMYKSTGKTIGFFRVAAYASIVFWISMIPFLLTAIGVFNAFRFLNLIWIVSLVFVVMVLYRMLLAHFRLKSEEAVVVMVLGVVGYFVIQWIVGRVFLGPVYRFL